MHFLALEKQKKVFLCAWLTELSSTDCSIHLWSSCTANSMLRHWKSRIESFNYCFMPNTWMLDRYCISLCHKLHSFNVPSFSLLIPSACFLSVPFDLPTSSWCWSIQKRGEENDCRSKINLECRKLRLNYFMCKLSWKLQAQYRKNIFSFCVARKGRNPYEKWPQKEMGSWRTGGCKPATCLLWNEVAGVCMFSLDSFQSSFQNFCFS